MYFLLLLTAIMSSFMLFFVIDISYNVRRMNNNLMKLIEKQVK